jgi:hypothetical protein
VWIKKWTPSMRPRPARCTTVDLQAWTGRTVGRPRRLIGQLRDACPGTGRGRNRALGFPDRVLLLVLAYRTNLTMRNRPCHRRRRHTPQPQTRNHLNLVGRPCRHGQAPITGIS